MIEVLADEEGGGLAARQVQREWLDELPAESRQALEADWTKDIAEKGYFEREFAAMYRYSSNTAATSLVPSAEEEMEIQFPPGALLVVQVAPESFEV